MRVASKPCFLLQSATHFKAIHPGQADIEEHDLRAELARDVDRDVPMDGSHFARRSSAAGYVDGTALAGNCLSGNRREAMRILATASVLSLTFVTPGFTQSPNQAPQSAQPANRCQLMTREEMELCKRTKPGDVSGARSSQCEVMAASEIEACLRQRQTNAAAGATGSKPQPQSDAPRIPTEPQERPERR